MKNNHYRIFLVGFLFLASSCAINTKIQDDFSRSPSSTYAKCSELAQGLIYPYPTLKNHTPKINRDSIFKKFESEIESMYATSGFKSKDELIKKATAHNSKQALNLLLNEELEIAMASPSKYRDDILKNGFYNFRESNQSQGATLSRENVEADYSGMDLIEYSKLDPGLKPKYGYVSPKPDSNLKAPEGIIGYGGDHYIFDLEKIRDQLTFTVGDSLNRHYNTSGGNSIGLQNITSWDQRFIPWKFRELAAPAITEGMAKSKKLGIEMETMSMSLEEIESEFPREALRYLIPLPEPKDKTTPVKWISIEGLVTPPKDWEEYQIPWGTSLDYIEVQIWDKINLDHLKAFVYTENPPSGKFLAELKKRGIEIRDGRQPKQ